MEQGLYGWEVIDCTVTVTRTGYQSPTSVAADFRGLAPIVLLRALQDAGTRVHEPCQALDAEIPAEALSPVLGKLAALGAEITGSTERGMSWTVSGELPVRLINSSAAPFPACPTARAPSGPGQVRTAPSEARPRPGHASTAIPSTVRATYASSPTATSAERPRRSSERTPPLDPRRDPDPRHDPRGSPSPGVTSARMWLHPRRLAGGPRCHFRAWRRSRFASWRSIVPVDGQSGWPSPART